MSPQLKRAQNMKPATTTATTASAASNSNNTIADGGVPKRYQYAAYLPSVTFAWLKMHSTRVKDYVYSFEPDIQAHWWYQMGERRSLLCLTCDLDKVDAVGADMVHLADWVRNEADKLHVGSLSVHVTPSMRYRLSLEPAMKRIAIDYGASVWMITSGRDAPRNNTWCVFAADAPTVISEVRAAYEKYVTQWLAAAISTPKSKVMATTTTTTTKITTAPTTTALKSKAMTTTAVTTTTTTTTTTTAAVAAATTVILKSKSSTVAATALEPKAMTTLPIISATAPPESKAMTILPISAPSSASSITSSVTMAAATTVVATTTTAIVTPAPSNSPPSTPFAAMQPIVARNTSPYPAPPPPSQLLPRFKQQQQSLMARSSSPKFISSPPHAVSYECRPYSESEMRDMWWSTSSQLAFHPSSLILQQQHTTTRGEMCQ
ncbi:MAG: hypothetical protein WC763_05480 [Candidatus Paceibacterota bacterium]